MTDGIGFTVNKNVSFVPAQPPKVGVTMTCEICVVATLFAVKLKSPMPLAARPEFVFEFVHVIVGVFGEAVKF